MINFLRLSHRDLDMRPDTDLVLDFLAKCQVTVESILDHTKSMCIDGNLIYGPGMHFHVMYISFITSEYYHVTTDDIFIFILAYYTDDIFIFILALLLN